MKTLVLDHRSANLAVCRQFQKASIYLLQLVNLISAHIEACMGGEYGYSCGLLFQANSASNIETTEAEIQK
jgi:hypothetical protein